MLCLHAISNVALSWRPWMHRFCSMTMLFGIQFLNDFASVNSKKAIWRILYSSQVKHQLYIYIYKHFNSAWFTYACSIIVHSCMLMHIFSVCELFGWTAITTITGPRYRVSKNYRKNYWNNVLWEFECRSSKLNAKRRKILTILIMACNRWITALTLLWKLLARSLSQATDHCIAINI
jgi:hypothetical protein